MSILDWLDEPCLCGEPTERLLVNLRLKNKELKADVERLNNLSILNKLALANKAEQIESLEQKKIFG